MSALTDYLPLAIPLLAALAGLVVAYLKHGQHKLLAEMLEEALVLEREREAGVPLAQLLREAAESKAEHDLLDVVEARVAGRAQSPES